MEGNVPPVETHEFLPHITLRYGPVGELMQLTPPASIPVRFDTVVVVAGTLMLTLPLDGDRMMAMNMGLVYQDDQGAPTLNPPAIAKADDERRYTFAPLYVPEADDSHGEWTSAEDLRKMVWGYMGKGSFDIRLQHLAGTVAGRCVEIVQWPFPLECDMATGAGVKKSVTLPAGTVYQGVHWEPWAYELVKDDKIRGLSLGGRAFKVPA